MVFSKKDAIRIASKAAEVYAKQLVNRNFLIVYRDRKTRKISWFETTFLPRNFQHLTGLEYIDSNGVVLQQSVDFFNKCKNHKLSDAEIRFKKDGTTRLKLEALPKVIDFFKSSKMTTVMNTYRPLLNVDRLTGNIFCCLGFNKDGDYYYPSSCLLGDIREYGDSPSQILAIYEKPISENIIKYKKIKYVAKGLDFAKIVLPKDLSEIIIR